VRLGLRRAEEGERPDALDLSPRMREDGHSPSLGAEGAERVRSKRRHGVKEGRQAALK